MRQMLKDWAPVVRDVLSVGLAALGSYLAYLAIRLGKEQAQIAKRQAEIAEVQHKIMLDQIGRKAVLSLHIVAATSSSGERYYDLAVENTGTKAAVYAYCIVSHAKSFENLVSIEFVSEANLEIADDLMNGQPWLHKTYWVNRPIYPGLTGIVGSIWIQQKSVVPEFTMYGRLVWEDGSEPEDGSYAEYKLPG